MSKSPIVVAGDVCIDWLSIPVEPVVPPPEPSAVLNWQLRGGRHMFARRGGAWLTADLTERATTLSVCKPEERPDLPAVPPDELIHSMLLLKRYARQRDDGDFHVWGVETFEGFAGPSEEDWIKRSPRPEDDNPDATLVLLDDAGNGFRDHQPLWPKSLTEKGKQPIVVYKVRRPLLAGKLWKLLAKKHLARTVVILNIDELRAEGASISRRLSWERTAADLVLALAHEPQFKALKQCAYVIVPIGLEGVLCVRPSDETGKGIEAVLWYVPHLIENDMLQGKFGGMAGFASAFAAAIAASIAGKSASNRLRPMTVEQGIKQGMIAARYLLEHGFGECKQGKRSEPDYPHADIFTHKEFPGFGIARVDLPAVPVRSDLSGIRKFRNWRILDVKRPKPIRQLAREIAIKGLKAVLPNQPLAKFGDLETIDRWEIESYRSIRNLLRSFLKNPAPERPLCLAVFGRPGSGKSFGVTQVAKSVAEKDQIEKFDFNLSQWESVGNLATALHRVRDSSLRGKVPLVFFDEFDSTFGQNQLGWLKYFLAPMQDGVFADENFTHQIGRAIFVFAGGTCHSFQQFRQEAELQKADVKAPDFLSRLRGHVDVFGADPLADTIILRRAMLLRSFLERKARGLFDGNKHLRIHPTVLDAFLNVPRYQHGIRSLEALIEMSQLHGRDQFDPSFLPPCEQMNLHVDGEAFLRILQSSAVLELLMDDLAKGVHKRYVEGEIQKVKHDPTEVDAVRRRESCRDWDPKDANVLPLDELFKDSNRDQVAHIPVKLGAVGCDVAAIDGQPGNFKFTRDEIESLARMEHERWMDERRLRQPDHPALVSWDKLDEDNKDKDRDSVRHLPELLKEAGLKIVRIR